MKHEVKEITILFHTLALVIFILDQRLINCLATMKGLVHYTLESLASTKLEIHYVNDCCLTIILKLAMISEPKFRCTITL